MKRTLGIALLLAGFLAGAGPAAAAERLITALSDHRVLITSNYTGVQLMLFGSVSAMPTASYARVHTTLLLPSPGRKRRCERAASRVCSASG